MPTVIDHAARPPGAAAIRAAGHIGAVRYISPDRTGGGLPGKPCTRAELDDLDRAGLAVGLVWQYGKDDPTSPAPPDFLRGRDGGLADARAAQAKLDELGRHDWPVFFAVDFDMDLDTWNRVGAPYLRACGESLGRERVGVYGHSRVCSWAVEDGLVGATDGGRHLCWQTAAWSGGEHAPEACLYQRPGTAYVGQTPVDVNDVLTDDWGQRPRTISPTPPQEAPVTNYPVLDWTARFTFGGPRNPAQISGVCIHVTVNSPGTPCDNVATYQINSESGSYHQLVDTRPVVLVENTDDWTTWSAGQTSNARHLHLSFVMRGDESPDQWLEHPEMLDAAAARCAAWAERYGIPVVKLDAAALRAGARGFCGHVDTAHAWGETDHVDPGPGFPWDHFLDLVRRHQAGATATPPDPREDPIMATIRSLIDPRKSFTSDEVLSFVDAATWQTRALLYEIAKRQGIDPKAVVDAAIAAERSK